MAQATTRWSSSTAARIFSGIGGIRGARAPQVQSVTMLMEHKSRLAALFGAAAEQLIAASGTAMALPAIVLERPKQAGHGDLACNLALQLARPLKASPRQVAERLKAAVEQLDRESASGPLLEALEIAGPGFINLRLRAAAKRAVVGLSLIHISEPTRPY